MGFSVRCGAVDAAQAPDAYYTRDELDHSATRTSYPD